MKKHLLLLFSLSVYSFTAFSQSMVIHLKNDKSVEIPVSDIKYIDYHAKSQMPTRGLIAYYPFDGNANDVINNNNGSVYGSSLTKDRNNISNSAYDFDGYNDYIVLGKDNILDIGNSDFTISVWVYCTKSSDGQHIFQRYSGYPNDDYFEAKLEKYNKPNFRFKNNRNTNNFDSDLPSSININQWTHLVFIKNDNQIKIYSNNNIISSKSNYLKPSNNQCLTVIGRNNWENGTNYFSGKIDDIRIYNRALSKNEIHSLYNE